MTAPISISAKTLRMMLAAVLPHAGVDDTLPTLVAVRFEVRDGSVLYLVGTDRYSLGVARYPIPGATLAAYPDTNALLSRAAAQEMFAELEGWDAIALVVGDEEVTVYWGSPEDASSWGVVDEMGSKWVDWRPIMHGALTQEPGTLDNGYAIGGEMLARFSIDPGRFPHDPGDPDDETGHAPPPEWKPEPVRVRIVGPAGPRILVTRGEWFLGVAQGMHYDSGHAPSRPPAPQWDDWTAVTTPAGKAGTA